KRAGLIPEPATGSTHRVEERLRQLRGDCLPRRGEVSNAIEPTRDGRRASVQTDEAVSQRSPSLPTHAAQVARWPISRAQVPGNQGDSRDGSSVPGTTSWWHAGGQADHKLAEAALST